MPERVAIALSHIPPAADSFLTPIDLIPAQWIWYPMGRCLPSTVVLFRREIHLAEMPAKAFGHILADSRYKLGVNGQRVQWGPAPCDPRWPEADPLDLTPYLRKGKNVICASVLFYGEGEGTWVTGKPGFLFNLRLEFGAGRSEQIVSDSQWQAHVAQSWAPGGPRRWYLRAFQEEFDARRYPYGWDEPNFQPDSTWRAAATYSKGGDKPSVCSSAPMTMQSEGDPKQCSIRTRSVPMLREVVLGGFTLQESALLAWHCPPEEYFACIPPDAFRGEWSSIGHETSPGVWQIQPDSSRTSVLTFSREEQVVGWPMFTIDAPAGTVVEMLVHEAHQPHSQFLLNTHFNSWTRFICREGKNHFETFDFESYRWVQFLFRKFDRPITLSDISVRRRLYPWPEQPSISCSDPVLEKLFAASVNTLNNSAQDTVVDGMARERQQYSGDGGHQLHALYYAFNESRLPARFVNTFSQGATPEGYFLDCWPAFDRVWRIAQRSLNVSDWGPILDHGIGFAFDCSYYYSYTGNPEMLKEAYPRFSGMVEYLQTIRDEHGLLKVENLGIPCVWMDHVAYLKQRHKQCAFNLYAAAMLQNALAPLARAFGDVTAAESVDAFGRVLQSAAVRRFWDADRRMFVANLPWAAEEGHIRTCDRSLATAILYKQCPGGDTNASVKMLENCPPEMGLSYPANAVWRYWALAESRSIQVVLDDLRTRWRFPSITENNTLQEDWIVTRDSGSQWSHCPQAPLIMLYHGIMGLRPISPGFAKCVIEPQLGDLSEIAFDAHTIRGTIRFSAKKDGEATELSLQVPDGIDATLILDARESVALVRSAHPAPRGCRSYRLPSGKVTTLFLKQAGPG